MEIVGKVTVKKVCFIWIQMKHTFLIRIYK